MANRSASRRPLQRPPSFDSGPLAPEGPVARRSKADHTRISAALTRCTLTLGQTTAALAVLWICSVGTIIYELCLVPTPMTVLASILATIALCGSTVGLFLELRRVPSYAMWLRPRSDWLLNNSDGIALTDSTVLLRRSKCADIYLKLESQPVRIIRSPPGSGKSSLGTLLLHNRPSWRACYRVDLCGWNERTTSFEDHWRKCTGSSIESSLDPYSGWPRTYIVDEAQCTFRLGAAHVFWKCLKHINARVLEVVPKLYSSASTAPLHLLVMILGSLPIRQSTFQMAGPCRTCLLTLSSQKSSSQFSMARLQRTTALSFQRRCRLR